MSDSQIKTLRNDSPVGAWVAQHPQTADVFDVHKEEHMLFPRVIELETLIG